MATLRTLMIPKLTPPTGHKLYFKDLLPKPEHFPFEGYLFNSGTAALCFLVKNLRIPPKSKILIPAYSCPTVAAAVLRAGHQPVLCDINLDDFGYDSIHLEKIIIEKKPEAIIWVNLFGLQKEIPEYTIPVIVDNAQLNPANYLRNCGAGQVYSFGRGKPINALGGGLVVINDTKYFKNPAALYNEIENGDFVNSIKYLISFFGYKVFYHPLLYNMLYSFPPLKLGDTIFNYDFSFKKIYRINLKVIENILSRVENIQDWRKNICERYDQIFSELSYAYKFFPNNIFYRYPVLIKEYSLRDQLVAELHKNGIGAFPFYPFPLNRQPILSDILNDKNEYMNADKISKSLLTFPINEFINANAFNKLTRICEMFIK